ncbi:hypothetical protein KBK24_0128305 [Burkholderia sp. K24]|nr:hypothetical protein KBK24_0128305 [Burkholderia sp. K24]
MARCRRSSLHCKKFGFVRHASLGDEFRPISAFLQSIFSLKYLQERYAAYLEGVFELDEADAENEAGNEVETDMEGTAPS